MMLDAPWLDAPEIRTLAEAFAKAGHRVRFVGGCVRDTILGREFSEVDAATDALPEQTARLLEAAGLRAIPTGIEHGTITALVNGKSYEITTLRKDVATDGRHAEVAFTDAWEEDAKRRDFTLNALYLAPDGTLYDYVNGFKDCKAARVIFIGDARERIREDYLRILRYFRFVATVGHNQFDAASLAACADERGGIGKLSGERIAAELLKLLAAAHADRAVNAMQDAGILEMILPVHDHSVSAITALDALKEAPLLKLAALIGKQSQLKKVSERLKLSNKQSEQMKRWLEGASAITPLLSTHEQKKLIRKLGFADYRHCVHLASAMRPMREEERESLLSLSEWTPPSFPVPAADLMEKGFEGKALGDKLKQLEQEWEESEYRLSKDDLLAKA